MTDRLLMNDVIRTHALVKTYVSGTNEVHALRSCR
jgi:hypothetical protein